MLCLFFAFGSIIYAEPLEQSDLESSHSTGEEALIEVMDMPAEESLTEVMDMPADKTLTEDTDTPADETLTEDTNTPADETLTEDTNTPADETLTEDTDTPADESLTENTDTPADKTLTEDTDTPADESLTEDTDIPAFICPLTGLETDKATVNSRPVAVVINNHTKARPQSGLSQAAICYEVLSEGNITRIVAVFHDFDTQRIGPVRSIRHYFVDFACDYDAILVYHGGSPRGYAAIKEAGVAALDAMRHSGTFWRDPERLMIPGMFEHSSYTGEALIREAQGQMMFRPVVHEGLNPGFFFYDEPTFPKGASWAPFVNVPFAEQYSSAFVYKDGLYYKSIEGTPQIDEETGERLSVSNILIQNVAVSFIPGDRAGRRDIDVIGEGSGKLLTHGGSVPIKWSKDSRESPTRWYNEDGSDLYLNKGKTWICLVSPDTDVQIKVDRF